VQGERQKKVISIDRKKRRQPGRGEKGEGNTANSLERTDPNFAGAKKMGLLTKERGGRKRE